MEPISFLIGALKVTKTGPQTSQATLLPEWCLPLCGLLTNLPHFLSITLML